MAKAKKRSAGTLSSVAQPMPDHYTMRALMWCGLPIAMLCFAVLIGLASTMSSQSADVLIPARHWKKNLTFNTAASVRCCDVERRHISGMKTEEWRDVYNGQKPVILQGVMDSWPAMKWDAAFFQQAPWASHPVVLTQHSALDVCMSQETLSKEIMRRHYPGAIINEYPSSGYTHLRAKAEAQCSILYDAKAETQAREVLVPYISLRHGVVHP